ncbi:MAG: hypothetical protein HC857_11895 [Synechococcales cyanobacterium RU_4_20]|nr:hypothetical protein [Synechococcales cyanobacterium RU_4_20]
MALTMALATLRSRTTSTKLDASRSIKKLGAAAAKGGLLQKLKRFGGWAIGQIFNFFNIDFDDIWDLVVDAYIELKEFDWNQTDKELEQSIKQNNEQILQSGARAIGEQLGIGSVRIANFFIGKFLPGTKGRRAAAAEGMKVPVLSSRIGLALAEDQNQQLRSDVENFLRDAGRAMTSNALINFVLTARREELFGMESITQDSEHEATLAGVVKKKLQKLPTDWQKPVEAALEGFESGVISAGYVIAREIDDDVDAWRYASQERKRDEDDFTVEIWPHSADEPGEEGQGEPIVFSGTRDEIKNAATTLLPAYDLLDDAGGDVATPMSWALKPGASRPQLAIIYRPEGRYSNHTLHIPHYGGDRTPNLPSYQKGSILGYWVLADGSKLQVYASTEREARKC